MALGYFDATTDENLAAKPLDESNYALLLVVVYYMTDTLWEYENEPDELSLLKLDRQAVRF